MKKILGTIAAAVALTASASASAVTIDLFTTGQDFLVDATIGGALFNQNAAPSASIIGGYRDLGVSLADSPNPANLNASIGVAAGKLFFSTDSQAKGTGLVRWDGSQAAASFTDVNTTGLGGIDLGDVFSSSFKLDIDFADAGFEFVLTAWTDATHWSSVTLTSLEHPTPGTSLIPYLAFLDCTNLIPGAVTTCAPGAVPGTFNPVNFASIGALEALIDPNGAFASLDLTIDAVSTIPEPGSLALAGLGLMGLAGLRRRRNSL